MFTVAMTPHHRAIVLLATTTTLTPQQIASLDLLEVFSLERDDAHLYVKGKTRPVTDEERRIFGHSGAITTIQEMDRVRLTPDTADALWEYLEQTNRSVCTCHDELEDREGPHFPHRGPIFPALYVMGAGRQPPHSAPDAVLDVLKACAIRAGVPFPASGPEAAA